MDTPSLQDLLESGAYFGHKKELSHPKAQKFIYNKKDDVNVINLESTIDQLKTAAKLIKQILAEKKPILFVGTKQQAREIIKKVALDAKMPYINSRWLGGTLTNRETIRLRINNYVNLQKDLSDEGNKKYTKKEKVKLEKELAKLDKFFFGLKDLNSLPGALFIVDPVEEHVALEEAKKLNIPVIAVCNTNVNFDKIDCPIPANDNAPKTIELICNYFGAVIKENTK